MSHNKLIGIITFYLIITISFLFVVSMNRHAFDTWVLEGIALPTIIFVTISAAAMICVNDIRYIIVIVAIFVVVMNIIPGFKYSTFYDPYDGPSHYRLTTQIASLGHVPEDEHYSASYGNNCAMHMFFASLSIISGFSVNDIFRFLIPLLFGLIPFIVYFIGRNILNGLTLKFAIIASGFPVTQGYDIWGTVLVFIPYFLLVAVYLRFAFSSFRSRLLLVPLALLFFTVIDSHAVTSLFVLVLLVGVFLASVFFKLTRRRLNIVAVRKSGLIALLYLLILLSWWLTIDTANLTYFVNYVTPQTRPPGPVIPTRFFQLSLVPQLQVLFVLNIANIVMVVLSALGLIMIISQIRKRKMPDQIQKFYLLVITLILITAFVIVTQVATNFGYLSYQRILIYVFPLCSFIVGWVISRVYLSFGSLRPIGRTVASVVVIVSLIVLCLFQFFPDQSMVPKANVLSSALPENAYILETLDVNTVFQKSMISSAETHSTEGAIITDSLTLTQSHGFSSPDFFNRIIYQSVLDSTIKQSVTWHLLLLHTSNAGAFMEKVEFRTDDIIQNLLVNSGDPVYSNGESFIVENPVS